VLRYLPTNLRGPEIAAEPFVSPNTTRAHICNACASLGMHSRAGAVTRAREAGLLSPTGLRR
jgi:LuxR family maltose regulon positive regulatory protein